MLKIMLPHRALFFVALLCAQPAQSECWARPAAFEPAPVSDTGGTASGTASGCPANTWTQVHAGGSSAPAAREQFGLASDTVRHKVVLFGGADAAAPLNDTWEWDGSAWTQRFPTQSPPARWGMAMTFDSVRNVTLMHGGQTAAGYFGDMWEWDGCNWAQVTSSGPAPAATVGHEMVFDSARGRVVLFGGANAYTDTWEWQGTGTAAGTWTRHPTSTGVAPGYRYYHEMVYDAARGVTILHGGRDAGGAPYPETWAWNGQAWSLLDVSGPSAGSSSWIYHAMGYDPVRGIVVLDPPGASDAWTWNGTTWTQFIGQHNGPRMRHELAWDSAQSRLIAFGGISADVGGVYFNDTWSWCSSATTQTPPCFQPVQVVGIEQGSYPRSVELTDLNGDGSLDVVTANSGIGTLTVLSNNGQGQFPSRTRITLFSQLGQSDPSHVTSGFLTVDSYPDLVACSPATDEVFTVLNRNNFPYQIRRYSMPAGADRPVAAVVGEFTGDGRPDVAVACQGSNEVVILRNTGKGLMVFHSRYPVGQAPGSIASGVLAMGCSASLVVGNVLSHNITVLNNVASGTPTTSTYACGQNPYGVAVGEVDGQPGLDIVAANSADLDVSLLRNAGNGTFLTQDRFLVAAVATGIEVGDLTADGRPEVVVASNGPHVVNILQGSPTGFLGPRYDLADVPFGQPLSVQVGDIDGDGDLDIVVANFGMANVAIFRNCRL